MTSTIDKLMKDGRIVTQARVVVHTTGPLGPDTPMSDNHWSIYLLLSKGGSLRLNMRANWDDEAEAWDTKGILDCSTHTYTQTNSCIEYWDYPVPDISIGQICTLLWNKERDSYEMSGGGSGCRYWVYVIIWLLEDNKYLSSGSTNALYPNLLFRYSKSGEKRDLPMVKGSFYESGRFTESIVQQSIQNKITPTPPAAGSPAATGSSSAAAAGGTSGSSQTEQPYYYAREGNYYYWDTQKDIQVDRPQNVWVKNVKGWSETNRMKYWRFWDGKKTYYQ